MAARVDEAAGVDEVHPAAVLIISSVGSIIGRMDVVAGGTCFIA